MITLLYIFSSTKLFYILIPAFNFLLVYKINLRIKAKPRIVGLPFCFIIFSFISFFGIAMLFSSVDDISMIIKGKVYEATITDTINESNDDGVSTIALLTFTDNANQLITKKADYSTSEKVVIGSKFNVIYNQSRNRIFTLSFINIVVHIFEIYFSVLLLIVYVGIVFYAFQKNTKKVISFLMYNLIGVIFPIGALALAYCLLVFGVLGPDINFFARIICLLLIGGILLVFYLCVFNINNSRPNFQDINFNNK